jgi:hypothetical protein
MNRDDLRKLAAEMADNGKAEEAVYAPKELDFGRLRREGIPEIEFLDTPYFPEGASVWVFGPTESAKSMFMMWIAARLTRMGIHVVYIQVENPLAIDFDRWERLRPDERFLHYYHLDDFDLARPECARWFHETATATGLAVLDTFSGVWSKGEDNEATIEFDSKIVVPIKSTGTTLATVHHEGHPQQFVSRKGAGAGRGGSAQGQKADVVLDLDATADQYEFVINHGKNRFGSKEQPQRMRVIDTDDGGLDIEAKGLAVADRTMDCADAMVAAIEANPAGTGSTKLRDLMKTGGFGTGTCSEAMEFLKREDPPRVVMAERAMFIADDGKERKGNVWRPAGATPVEITLDEQ